MRFHIIDDAAVILRRQGVFRQAKVFRRGRDVYAALGGGFIGLYAGGGTSVPTISWEDLEGAGPTETGRFNKLMTAPTRA